MMKKLYRLLLYISAFLVPFYFVYYGPMHQFPENAMSKSLQKLVLAGFCFYAILIVVIIVLKNGT